MSAPQNYNKFNHELFNKCVCTKRYPVEFFYIQYAII